MVRHLGRQSTSFHQPVYPVEYPTDPALVALLGKLQDKAVQHRLRPAEFFRDFDKHGDGTVTQPQFIQRLTVAYDKMGIGLADTETKLLLSHYGKTMRHGDVRAAILAAPHAVPTELLRRAAPRPSARQRLQVLLLHGRHRALAWGTHGGMAASELRLDDVCILLGRGGGLGARAGPATSIDPR